MITEQLNSTGESGVELGLIYDSDAVALSSYFTDEISMFRARRNWATVLNNYFLLEKQRDYDVNHLSSLETKEFTLECRFTSACGRYAFWRLINGQAPDAEAGLAGCVQEEDAHTFLKKGLPDKENSWIIQALDEQIDREQGTMSIIQKLKDLLR